VYAAGTFVVNRIDGNNGGTNCTNGGTGNLVAAKITSGPTINASWCGTHFGLSVPSTSMTAAGMNPIVWTFSSSRLYAYDGETGTELFNGGGANDAMTGGTSYFSTPVIAKGRVWVAAKSHLYVFTP
jgi:outer membrane protein assembly factor BamB